MKLFNSLLRTLLLLISVLLIGSVVFGKVDPVDAPRAFKMMGPEVKITADEYKTEVGEPIRFVVDLPVDGDFKSVKLELPEEQSELALFGESKKVTGKKFEITGRFLSPGETSFGPVVVKVLPVGAKDDSSWITMSAKPFTMTVSPPQKEMSGTLKEFTAPKELPFDYFWRNIIIVGVILLLLVILALIAVIVLFYVVKNMNRKPVVAPLAPVEAAMIKIEELKKLDVFREEGAERHYTMLSNALRGYFEGQFVVHALEMTEDEVVRFLQNELPHVPLTDTLVEVLQRSSMAKFAKQELTEEIALGDCQQAENFLVSEKQRLERERLAAMNAMKNQREKATVGELENQEDRAA